MSTSSETGKVIGAIGPTSQEAANATKVSGSVVVGKASDGRYFALPTNATTDAAVGKAGRILARFQNSRSRNSST